MTAPPPSGEELAGGVSLDALFRANAVGRPELIALADPPNREGFTDGPPRRLTFDQTNLAVERLAQKMQAIGLPTGSVVAVQLPNIVESIVALLAIMRAGLIAAPVPMAWRRSDLVAALGHVEPKALITLARLDEERPAKTACEVAAELFSLSFPCAFGEEVPDGVIPLELDISEPAPGESPLAPSLAPGEFTIVTFDATSGGFFPVGRGDPQWLAIGLSALLEARIDSGDAIISTLPPNSLAGIGGAVVPWLLSGGTLELVHGPAVPPIPAGEKGRRRHLLGPASAIPELVAKLQGSVASCIAVDRQPGGRNYNYSSVPTERMVDFTIFGETGAVALRRRDPEEPRSIPLGAISAPSEPRGGPIVLETEVADGELLLRGAMIPRSPFPAGPTANALKFRDDGFAHTGFRCRRNDDGGFVVVSGPDGVVTVGGLRFGLDDLRSRFSSAVANVRVASVKDPLLGERLHIETDNPPAAAAALRAAGHSPLVVYAAASGPARSNAVG